MAPQSKMKHRGGSDDLEIHRSRITEIYKKHTLERVMEIMRREHDVFATKKVYKARLSRWGLHKNFRAKEPCADLITRKNRGNVPFEIFHGKLGPEETTSGNHPFVVTRENVCDLRQQAKQDLLRFKEMAPIVLRETPYPAPSMGPFFQLPEECIHIMRDYVAGAFDSGVWKTDREPHTCESDPTTEWFRCIIGVEDALLMGRMKQAFHLLDSCCRSYRGLIRAQTPRVLIFTYLAAIRFSEKWPDVSRALISYSGRISQVVYGTSSHPFSLLMEKVYRMSSEEVRVSAMAILESYFENFEERVEKSSMFETDLQRDHGYSVYTLSSCGALDLDKAEPLLRNLASKSGLLAPRVNSWLIDLYYEGERLQDARRLGAEILKMEDKYGFNTIYNVYRVLFFVSVAEGNHKATLVDAQRLIDYCMAQGGRGSPNTVSALSYLEFYLRDRGDVEAADKLLQHAELGIEDLCRRLKNCEVDGNDYTEHLQLDKKSIDCKNARILTPVTLRRQKTATV